MRTLLFIDASSILTESDQPFPGPGIVVNAFKYVAGNASRVAE